MLILLPPSEGKTDGTVGSPVETARLSSPELTRARLRVGQTLVRLCEGRPKRARSVLGLSDAQDAELDRNRRLFTAPAAPAAQIYSGVLFDALGYGSLSATARKRADDWVRVSSALWGVVQLTDRIAAYRLSADVTLPRIGPVASFWRKQLGTSMSSEAVASGPVLDLRSGAYAKLWTPPVHVASQVAVARIMQRRPDGSAKVVSHHNKATKGRLVRALVRQRSVPRSVSELAELVTSLGFAIDALDSPPGRPTRLDIVVDDL